MNRWLVNAMRAQKMDVVVVDAVKLNLRMLGKKTDRRDAYEIARRLWLGDIDRNAKTYYPDEDRYGCRKVLRTRHKLVQVRQQLVNQVRGLLNAYRIEAPKAELSSKKNLEWLAGMERKRPGGGGSARYRAGVAEPILMAWARSMDRRRR
jgi:transposase